MQGVTAARVTAAGPFAVSKRLFGHVGQLWMSKILESSAVQALSRKGACSHQSLRSLSGTNRGRCRVDDYGAEDDGAHTRGARR